MIRCHFCRCSVASVDDAVAANWIPSFHRGDEEIPNPVCQPCWLAYLVDDEYGELCQADPATMQPIEG